MGLLVTGQEPVTNDAVFTLNGVEVMRIPAGSKVPQFPTRGKLMVEHRVAANVPGGASSAGVNLRPLNLVTANGITGASLDVATSQITLPAGTYDVEGYSAVFATGGNQAFLTPLGEPTNYLAIGTAGESYTATGADSGRSILYGRFTLAATTVLVLRHWTLNARATNGFGVAANSGVPNVHAALTFQKVA